MSRKVPICDNITTAVPRCLCGATVAECVIQKCHQTLYTKPDASISINEWKQACLLESPYCANSQREACSIIYNEERIKKYNLKPVSNTKKD